MRSIWKGSISFGLVNIPIQLYTATQEKRVSFNLLHNKCRTPINYSKTCQVCNQTVANEDLIKGYMYAPDQYVLITDEDLASLPLPTIRSIEILHFVALSEVDPIYYTKTYYIEPQERSDKAYGLLMKAMEASGKIAIAKVSIRQKESLSALRIHRHLLTLHLMFYPDEVKDPEPLRGNRLAAEPSEKEMSIARQLIDSLSVPFDPHNYHDEYRGALLNLIDRKIQGQEGVVAQKAPVYTGVQDLMSALEASLKELENKEKNPKKELIPSLK
jgi:DNA end-binding protein Ku